MSHISELSTAIRDALLQMPGPTIRPKITFRGYSLTDTSGTNGAFPTWSASKNLVEFEITTAVSSKEVFISIEKPLYPSGDKRALAKVTTMTVETVNPAEWLSVIQSGGVIDFDRVEQIELTIEAQIGTAGSIPFFKGRVVGPPSESPGLVRWSIRDSANTALNRPVLFEKFDSSQDSYIDTRGRFINTAYNAHGDAQYYDGYVSFDEQGSLISTLDLKGDVDLVNLTIKNKARPGVYTIEFFDSQTFSLTYPGNSVFAGTTQEDFESDHIDIDADFWSGTAERGDKISFQVPALCVSGNPIEIAKNLIEKAYSQDYGNAPTYSTGHPVDWAAFDALQEIFADFRVYVTEGNTDNRVWEKRKNSKPLSHLDMAQLVLNHCLCTLTSTAEGKITVKGPYYYEDNVYEIKDDFAILSHGLSAPVKVNYIETRYGYNYVRKNYGLEFAPLNLRQDNNDEIESFTLNLPYYKAGRNFNEVEAIQTLIRKRYFDRRVDLTADITPQFGIALLPGDQIKFIIEEQPKTTGYFTIQRVRKGIGTKASIVAAQTQEPEGYRAVFCDALTSDKVF